MTPQPEQPHVVGREESIEYRDEKGNLLDPEQVAALQREGKVSFSTRYETRTRVYDPDGKLIEGDDSHAPPHPDVEGQNPETGARPGSSDEQQQSPVSDKPASAAGEEGSVRNEKQNNSGQPKPASEGKEATKQAS